MERFLTAILIAFATMLMLAFVEAKFGLISSSTTPGQAIAIAIGNGAAGCAVFIWAVVTHKEKNEPQK